MRTCTAAAAAAMRGRGGGAAGLRAPMGRGVPSLLASGQSEQMEGEEQNRTKSALLSPALRPQKSLRTNF